MSEVDIQFSIPSTSLKVYGRLREVDDAPIIVMVHGLAGHMDEQQFYNGARAFSEAGFANLRINLYGEEPDARNLIDCTIDTHVNDVDVVLRSLRSLNPDRKIGVIGHSLGALVIQRVDRFLFDAAVLWEPADTAMKGFADWPNADFLKAADAWLIHWGSDVLISSELERTWWHTEPDNYDLACPTKIIGGSDSWLLDASRRYAAEQSSPSELSIIEGADHSFNVADTARILHDETISWFQTHLA